MKKVFSIVMVLSALMLIFTGNTNAQKKKSFSGSITFEITYGGSIDAAQLAQLPKTAVMKILGNKTRLETGGGVETTITDGDSKTILILLDIAQMGKKFAIKQTKQQIDDQLKDQPAPIIKYIDETKEIAGFKVKKAEILSISKEGNDTVKVVCWYTEEIGSQDINFAAQFRGLNGQALEYSINTPDISMTYIAKEIKKGNVKATDFLQPTDYEETTMDKIREMFGVGGEEE